MSGFTGQARSNGTGVRLKGDSSPRGENLCRYAGLAQFGEVVQDIERGGELAGGRLHKKDGAVGESQGLASESHVTLGCELPEAVRLPTVAPTKPYLPPNQMLFRREFRWGVGPQLAQGGQADLVDAIDQLAMTGLVLRRGVQILTHSLEEVTQGPVGHEDSRPRDGLSINQDFVYSPDLRVAFALTPIKPFQREIDVGEALTHHVDSLDATLDRDLASFSTTEALLFGGAKRGR